MTIRRSARIVITLALASNGCSNDRAQQAADARDTSVARDSVPVTAANRDSLVRAIEAAEESLRVHGDDSSAAARYFRLGRLKRLYEPRLSYGTPRAEYARAHPEQYRRNEVGADYLYNGYHFRELLRRFPSSEWADDAAWEMTLLPRGGECEGYIPCYITREFDPVAEFLRAYPASPFVAEGARRADEAFTRPLADIVDLTEPAEGYTPGEIQALLARYDTLAEQFPVDARARATLTIADLWSRFLNRDRARALYSWLATSGAVGVDTADVRRRMNALTGETLVLRPARVVSDRRVELSWDPPPDPTLRGYAVLRSLGRDSAGQLIAELSAEAQSYSDETARAGGDYWYSVRARTATLEIASNPVHVTTPVALVRPRAMVFRPNERMLYIFGYLDNGFPRVLQISEKGAVVAAHDGALYGLERYAPQDHRFDAYTNEAWVVDVAGQAFLRFRKTPDGFGDDVPTAIHAGATSIALDTTGMPYYGFMASIDLSRRRMWLAPRGRAYALAWDYRRNVAWEGREGGLRQTDAADRTIREIPLPPRNARENEFVTALWAHVRSGSVWAYLSRKGAVVRIDSSGAITQSLALEPYIGDEPRWIAFDFAHDWVWAVTGPVVERSLVQFSLADGRTLRSTRLEGIHGHPYLVADTTSGGLWLLQGNRLVNFDSTAAVLFQTTVPTTR